MREDNVSDINALIYIAEVMPIYKVYGKLLETIMQRNLRVHIVCSNKDEMNSLDYGLWNYAQLSFLTHATEDDDFLEEQKIVLSINQENCYNADVVIMNHAIPNNLFHYKKLISIYSIEEQNSMVEQYHRIKNLNIACSIFEQTANGWKERLSI